MSITEWLDSAVQDARYGLRQLRKTPVVSLAMLLSLSIGIGANTAIFSLVDAAILKPLPVKDPDSLPIIEWTNEGFPEGATNINGDFNRISGDRVQASSVAANQQRRLAREQTVFEALLGIADLNSVDASPAEQVSLQYVSSNFFQALGTLPAIGRPFLDDEDRLGHEPVLIVSHRFWMTEFHTQTALIDRLLRTERLLAFMSSAFGVIALSLAAIGLGGLLAYAVARRTNEIGVRMTLGAAAGDVIWMVLRDSLWMVGTGILMGLPCAYAVGRVLETALFRLEPLDRQTAALAFFSLSAIALLAAWVPARRAASIDPMTALREE